MGWCHEFGAEIAPGCAHVMVAGENGCACKECGAVCRGRFAGCARVWARANAAAAAIDNPPVVRTHVTPASWAAAASRPAGFRHTRGRADSTPPGPDAGHRDDADADVETLKEQVRQLTLLTERLAGRLDAVLARPPGPPRKPASPAAATQAPPTPAPRRAPAPPAPTPPAPAPAPPAAAWPPDGLDKLVARTEWKQLRRFLRGSSPPPPGT